ncbi:MAG: hypothetical protein JWR17_1537 [Pseudomonas sp.]|jgi:hypothetical protein|uniref:hypothetical protein n=1 Tax=Pseudomonas sp. TaxID=306 RepID=UPI00262E6FBA|nr:hypothetical protein [Pseudomonas sp.]MDB6048791.1 hypothetical protein [Pseudomonas sp.]
MGVDRVSNFSKVVLPEMFVLELGEDGVLSPDRRGGVYVAIDYGSAQHEDKVSLFWNGARSPIQFPGKPNGPIVQPFPVALVAPDVGKEVTVRYEVLRASGEIEESAPTTFLFRNFIDGELPMPKMELDVTDGILDTRYLKEDVLVTLRRWPLMAAGQNLWLNLVGTGQSGQPLEITVWEAVLESPLEYDNDIFTLNFPSTAFDDFGNASFMQLVLRSRFDMTSSAADIVFPPMDFKLVNIASDEEYQNFENEADKLIGLGQTLKLPGMSLSIIGGDFDCGVESVGDIAGVREGPALIFCKGGAGAGLNVYQVEFDKACIAVELFYSFIISRPVTVNFFDESQAGLGTITFNREGKIKFISPHFRKAKYMWVGCNGELYLDFFKLSR